MTDTDTQRRTERRKRLDGARQALSTRTPGSADVTVALLTEAYALYGPTHRDRLDREGQAILAAAQLERDEAMRGAAADWLAEQPDLTRRVDEITASASDARVVIRYSRHNPPGPGEFPDVRLLPLTPADPWGGAR